MTTTGMTRGEQIAREREQKVKDLIKLRKNVLAGEFEVSVLEKELTAAISSRDGGLTARTMDLVLDCALTYSLFDQFSPEFYLNVFFPAFEKNNLFWRLLRLKKLDFFLNKLHKLFSELKTNLPLFRKIIDSVRDIENPTIVYYIARALRDIDGVVMLRGESENDLALMAELFINANRVALVELEVNTVRCFVEFFARVSDLSTKILERISDAVAIISHKIGRETVDEIFRDIYKCLRLYKHTPTEFPTSLAVSAYRVFMYWTVAKANQDPRKFEIMTCPPFDPEITMFNFLMRVENPDRFKDPENAEMDNKMLSLGIPASLSQCHAAKHDFFHVRHIFLSIFERHLVDYIPTVFVTTLSYIKELKKTPMDTLMVMFVVGLVDSIPVGRITKNMRLTFLKHFKGLKALDRWSFGQNRPQDFDHQEIEDTLDYTHVLQIRAFSKMTIDFENREPVSTKCIEILRKTKSLEVKLEIFKLMARLMKNLKTKQAILMIEECGYQIEELLETTVCAETIATVIKEYLKIAEIGWSIDQAIERKCIEIANDHLNYIIMCPQLGLLYSTALLRTHRIIGVMWCGFVAELATLSTNYPENQMELLYHANRKMYEAGHLGRDEMALRDEITPKTRLRAIVILLEVMKRGVVWQKSVISLLLMGMNSNSHVKAQKSSEALLLLNTVYCFNDDWVNVCCSFLLSENQGELTKLPLKCMIARVCMKDPTMLGHFVEHKNREALQARFIENKKVTHWIDTIVILYNSLGSKEKAMIAQGLYKDFMVFRQSPTIGVRVHATAALLLMSRHYSDEQMCDVRKDLHGEDRQFQLLVNHCQNDYIYKTLDASCLSFITIFNTFGTYCNLRREEVIPVDVIRSVLKGDPTYKMAKHIEDD